MFLSVKGPSNQHCIAGGGGMREFGEFLRKCPKTFGQDCGSPDIYLWTLKLGKGTQLNDLNPFLDSKCRSFSSRDLLSLYVFAKRKFKMWCRVSWYDEYQMQHFCSQMIVLYMNLPGIVDCDLKLKIYLASQVTWHISFLNISSTKQKFLPFLAWRVWKR